MGEGEESRKRHDSQEKSEKLWFTGGWAAESDSANCKRCRQSWVNIYTLALGFFEHGEGLKVWTAKTTRVRILCSKPASWATPRLRLRLIIYHTPNSHCARVSVCSVISTLHQLCYREFQSATMLTLMRTTEEEEEWNVFRKAKKEKHKSNFWDGIFWHFLALGFSGFRLSCKLVLAMPSALARATRKPETTSIYYYLTRYS